MLKMLVRVQGLGFRAEDVWVTEVKKLISEKAKSIEGVNMLDVELRKDPRQRGSVEVLAEEVDKLKP